jgi:branched-chain amino acid transport system permease protein
MKTLLRVVPAVVLVVVFACLPLLTAVTVPGLFDGAIGSAGSLQVLAVALIYAALAMSFDMLYGFTGLLSFGHTLWFAIGLYFPAVIMRELELPFFTAVLITLVATVIVALAVGSLALRVYGIAFAMVTLAFAETFLIFVERNPTGLFGGDEGVRMPGELVPQMFRGVVGMSSIYILAVALVVVVYLLLRQSVRSRAGSVWQALSENPLRVELIGLRPYRYRLMSFVLAAVVACVCGNLYLLVVKSANPGVAGSEFALLILVMVVVGGSGRLWGAALGGFLYGFASLRLGDVSTSGFASGLPSWIEGPLTEPQFYIGLVVVLLMVFAPGGVAGIVDAVRRSGTARSRTPTAPAPAGPLQ